MSEHPNLLFIYTDEQRFDTLAAYGNQKIQMPAVNALAEDDREHRNATKHRDEGSEGHSLQAESDWRALNARYWGQCSQVDQAVGRILTTLGDAGLYDDTIVVFTSDHGDMMGADSDPGLPGTSWLPSLAAGKSPRGDVFVEWNPRRFFDVCNRPEETDSDCSLEYIRTLGTPDLVKLNWSSRGEHQLFDLARDPLELNNLLASDSGGSVLNRMDTLTQPVRAWQAETADPAILPVIND